MGKLIGSSRSVGNSETVEYYNLLGVETMISSCRLLGAFSFAFATSKVHLMENQSCRS